jgi:N-methylhydantoinase A
MAYLGVDIGGTFTDVVYVADDGDVAATKTPSTPPDFDRGFLAGVEKVAALRGEDMATLLASCDVVLHGTTVATNAVVQMRGSKVGVITTRGHRDCLPAMRSSGRAKGLTAHEILHASSHHLPTQVVDTNLICEVDERMDSRGNVAVALNESQVTAAATELRDKGVEAIAVCFLWSVATPRHELRARELVQDVLPDAFVTCSHEASARNGEYERFTAAALNAFLGPETRDYVTRLKDGLVDNGLRGRLVIMQASGGVASDERAARLPVLTIGSGPSAGVTASLGLAQHRGEDEVIATDMGGTSFDVALIANGSPLRSRTSIVNQYEFYLPRTDIRSIGAGGGSIVRYDEATETLKVGPTSAGARPGPVCYGQGGTAPTITDANVLLGYLNPGNFLGGEIQLDVPAAEAALAEVGAPLRMSAVDVAVAARRIVAAQMADLIRQMTVERGMDPREFALYAYGGAGGLHVAAYLRELGCAHAVIPLGTLSTTWSAYGCATSDLLQIYERPIRMKSPIDVDVLRATFAELEDAATADLVADGIPADRQVMERTVEIKYPLQIHQVEVRIEESDTAEQVLGRFIERYEQLYGSGSAWTEAAVEVVSCRVVARGTLLQPQARAAGATAASGQEDERLVVWIDDDGSARELATRVVSTTAMEPGSAVEGPLIIEAETTTVVVPPGASAIVTTHGDLMLELGAPATAQDKLTADAIGAGT